MKTKPYKQMPEIDCLAINILSFLHANQWLVRMQKIQHAVGKRYNAVRYQVDNLRKEGLVTTEEGKQYKITDKGEEVLEYIFGDSIKAQKGTIF